jgi:ribonucleoside-diphosphate reductase beta chain
MSITDFRANIKPYEYPELLKFKDSIRHSYWVHDEFNFNGDVQDFKVSCTDAEREVIKRTMLAIAQIEVSVKTFWADICKRLPKPEVAAVGMTFAESEVRHADAYSHLLEIMGFNGEFGRIEEIPAIADRIEYLDRYQSGRTGTNREFAMSVLLFSIFIEHVSLFSQFLIMTAFDKYDKRFKGIANAVEATSKEEQIHGLFGRELISILQDECPEWFSEDAGEPYEDEVRRACRKAFKAEMKVLDWIFEEGGLDFLGRDEIDEFLKDRFNESLESVGVDPIFETDDDLLAETRWFNEDILMTKDNDFFSKRGTAYNKNSKSVTAGDLF